MKYDEFRQQLETAESDAYQGLRYGMGEVDVLVVDEEGFIHNVNGALFDKESGAFWIRSSFRCDKETT